QRLEFFDGDHYGIRPLFLYLCDGHPGFAQGRFLQLLQIHCEKAGADQWSETGTELLRADPLERTIHFQPAYRPALAGHDPCAHPGGSTDRHCKQRQHQPDAMAETAAGFPPGGMPGHIAAGISTRMAPCSPPGSAEVHKLVSRIRQTSSSKPTPMAAAACGTRLWSVIPGVVFTSKNQG